MLITIFTPTYNRASNLKALYDSLLAQTYKEFEWIVVDDGSKDSTKEIMNDFCAQGKIRIIHEYQENSGKHIAINRGAQLAKGFLFFVVDSDDHLTPNALERFVYHWNEIQKIPSSESENIIGLGANRARIDGSVIGGNPPYNTLITDLLDYRFNRKILGDKAEMYITKIVKENPFPKIDGERFCPEALIFYRLADNGKKILFFNENVYISEYLEGGLSLNGLKTLKNGPIASLQSYADVVGFKQVPFLTRIKFAILFWRFSFFDKKQNLSKQLQMLPSSLYLLLYPFGFIYHLRDGVD